MAAKSRTRLPASRKGKSVYSAVVLLALGGLVLLSVFASAANSPMKSPATVNQRGLSLARVYPYVSYDEQVGVTFTQDFSSLAFNVSAIAQTGPDGVGPAYLLDGLTDVGYWYQVGLSWKWPSTNGAPLSGFNMNYEVFDQYGYSVFPTNGGGGIDTIHVNSGDLVLLNLNFTGSDVVMQATDWNTTSTATEFYPAYGASHFVGLPNSVSSNGFFTGLMTEEYHSAPYNGTGQPVLYQENSFNMSSAWVWADEFNTAYNQQVFSDATTSAIDLSNATQLNYFSSYGTAEAVSGQQFITGLSPIRLPTLTTATSPTHRMGENVTITLSLENTASFAIKVRSLIISTSFGAFDVSSSAPSTAINGNSTFPVNITIPLGVATGNYTLTTTVNWQFLDPQLKEWLAPEMLQANTTILVNGTAVPSTTPPSTRPPSTPPTTTTTTPSPEATLLRAVQLPAFLAYVAAVGSAVALVIRRERRQTLPGMPAISMACKACGSMIGQTMLFCPNCGTSLTSPSDHASVSTTPQPPYPA